MVFDSLDHNDTAIQWQLKFNLNQNYIEKVFFTFTFGVNC